MVLLAIVAAFGALGFSGNYLSAASACNSPGELYACSILADSLNAQEQDAACDCACAEVFGTFGECDVTGCCLCAT